jgi:hypothetical protein
MFTSVKFRNFKSLKDFTVSLKRVNVLVGPNNAGKSSVLDAFRALSAAQTFANRRNPSPINIGRATVSGYEIPTNQIPISLENIHSDYNSEQETSATYQIENGNRLKLQFLDNSRCVLVAENLGRQIQNTSSYILQCTCGSAVLFDEPRPPWDEHDCSQTGTIGRSGLKGWIAADVLRANGVGISPKIMGMLFPKSSLKKKPEPSPQPIKKIGPKLGQALRLLAVVREISHDTKRTAELDHLSGVGAKLLDLPKGKLWQITLVVNTERPNLSYTCVLPASLRFLETAKNKMVLATLEAKIAGSHAIWLVTSIELL